MILLLTDETWQQMLSALVATDAGRAVADRLHAQPELPGDRELIRMARHGEPAPAAVTRMREQRDAGRDAAESTRKAMNDLLVHVHGAGVPVATIARWFDLKPSRIYEVLKEYEAVA